MEECGGWLPALHALRHLSSRLPWGKSLLVLVLGPGPFPATVLVPGLGPRGLFVLVPGPGPSYAMVLVLGLGLAKTSLRWPDSAHTETFVVLLMLS